MTFLCRFVIFASLILCPAAARAQTGLPDTLHPAAPAMVSAIEDGFVLNLDDGRVIRLPGIELPESIWRKGAADWLEAHVKGRMVTPFTPQADETGRIDRYGRVLAHVVLDDKDGTWLQQALVRNGLARVQALPDNARATRILYAAEEQARARKTGIWSDPRFGIRSVEDVQEHLYSEEIVEGRVRAAKDVRGRVYLNFGDDWKTDFTVSIAKGDLRRFKAAGMDPLSWAGQVIRVRGWVKSYNGPMIEATHPEQIELPSSATSYIPD